MLHLYGCLLLTYISLSASFRATSQSAPSHAAADALAPASNVSALLEDPPWFAQDVPPDRIDIIVSACHYGAAWVASAIRRLPYGDAELEKWMGDSGEYTKTKVRDMLTKVLDVLENTQIVQGKRPPHGHCDGGSSEGGKLAYVHTSILGPQANGFLTGQYMIFVCDLLFHPHYKNRIVGTFIREAAHHHGMDDHTAGKWGCQNLAKHSPRIALNNMDSYLYLISDLVFSYWGPLYAMRPLAHPVCTTECGAGEVDGIEMTNGRMPRMVCAQCQWSTKPGFLSGGAACSTEEQDTVSIKTHGTCYTNGCRALASPAECEAAGAKLGLGVNLTRKPIWSRAAEHFLGSDSPAGCHVEGPPGSEGSRKLIYTAAPERAYKPANEGDALVCSCPSPRSMAAGRFRQACCTTHTCKRPAPRQMLTLT